MVYLPPPIWRLIFSFDPTFPDAWKEVVTELGRMKMCDKCGLGPSCETFTATEPFVDYEIRSVTGLKLSTFSCRFCGLQTSAGLSAVAEEPSRAEAAALS